MVATSQMYYWALEMSLRPLEGTEIKKKFKQLYVVSGYHIGQHNYT